VKHLPIFIITGLSGSGKSTVVDALEDAGFYCVDNMPVDLLPKFLELPLGRNSEIAGIALVMDLREKGFIGKYESVFQVLREKGYRFEILFLEADENTLVRRYSATRRQHPLSQSKGLLEGIRAEKRQLAGLRQAADRVLDTTELNVHELKARVFDLARARKELEPLRIHIISFGFKQGIPNDADLIIDVRFIQNPYFVPELKPLDGRSERIREFVLNREETSQFLDKYLDLLDFLIPLYEKEGKTNLTLAVGCTGGRHRSVVIAQRIYEHLKQKTSRLGLTHRDLE
jgi:UPF0042 nucleotide-binding protein